MNTIKETPLCKLAFKYSTDKCPKIKHVYTPFYYELLKDKKHTFKKVLEMGIGYKETMPYYPRYQTGASLKMWRDFFPNAMVHGADISPKAMFEDERIKTYLCDERKKCDIERLVMQTGSDIDLVVDDGSHRLHHQVYLCKTIMPLLQKSVIYIIEDVGYNESLSEQLEKTGLYKCEFPDLPGRTHAHGKIVRVKRK